MVIESDRATLLMLLHRARKRKRALFRRPAITRERMDWLNETSTGDGDPMPQVMWGQAPAKQRRHKWLLALKAAGLRRRTRRN